MFLKKKIYSVFNIKNQPNETKQTKQIKKLLFCFSSFNDVFSGIK